MVGTANEIVAVIDVLSQMLHKTSCFSNSKAASSSARPSVRVELRVRARARVRARIRIKAKNRVRVTDGSIKLQPGLR